jgi:archaellum component FlaC
MIDRKISTEMQKVKQQVRNELKTVSDKVENLEKSYESIKENRNRNTPEQIRAIV